MTASPQEPLRPYVPDVGGQEKPLRIGMYGTAHSHASGKARALVAHPQVEFAGVYEPDAALRAKGREQPGFAGTRWMESAAELLDDPSIVAVCVEGDEGKCWDLARQCVAAGKHIWYDKPCGDWPVFQEIIHTAQARRLLVQMGFMLRYGAAFQQVYSWVREGLLGDVFAVRGHMSTSSTREARERARYTGGIAFQLAPHMIDQAVYLFGGAREGVRPDTVTSFLRNDATPGNPSHADNTLVVLEFDKSADRGGGMAMIDISQMETASPARRFEVYGTKGSAIVVEPIEPGPTIRLCLDEARGAYAKGAQLVPVEPTPRERSYHLELAAFVRTLLGQQLPERSLDHELLVEETLHRAVGTLSR